MKLQGEESRLTSHLEMSGQLVSTYFRQSSKGGRPHLRQTRLVDQPRSAQNPVLRGFTEASSHRVIDYIIGH